MAGELGVEHKTVAAQTRILENLFLVWRLQPWPVNLTSRQVKTAKIYVADTGLLTHLVNIDADRLVDDANVAGSVFETFVAVELARQSDWAQSPPTLFHYRDKQQREVDVILELGSGEVAGARSRPAPASGRETSRACATSATSSARASRRAWCCTPALTRCRSATVSTPVPLCGLWA
jgi:uncharacterized protein